jgi:hypothetical protein
MKGFQAGIYLVIVVVAQFFITLIYGRVNEGDINAASMYPVVYLLPAVLFNIVSGLVTFFKGDSFTRFLFMSLIILFSVLLINEILQPKPYELFRVIIIVSFVVNALFFFFARRRGGAKA